MTSASSVAHDLFASVIKKGQASERSELIVARLAAIVIGAIAIALAIPAQRLNIAFLVALAFAVAASANLPALLFNLFWKKFNTAGAVSSIYGGLIAAVGLVVFSPVVSGAETSMFPTPTSPGSRSTTLGSSPSRSASSAVSFLCGVMGTLVSRDTSSQDRFAELEVRSLTGAGAERAVQD